MTTTPVAHENEHRIYGPPGTGKTTYLSRQITLAAQKHGSDSIVVGSFTKAAATELTGRHLPLGQHQIGTLHALAYRKIGHPTIAQGRLKEWNERHPHLAMDGQGVDMDEGQADQVFSSAGSELLARYDNLRARMVDEETWPTQVRAFARKWEAWKEDSGYLDFTDLIEICIEEDGTAPGAPSIGFFDEVQDFTPLELELVRGWGRKMDMLLLAGDDDQCIYSFKGSTPDAFLDPPIPQERKRVLSQSYRVPLSVHRMAEAWVHQLTRREEKDYHPRDEAGSIGFTTATWRNPEPLLSLLEDDLSEGRTAMVLTTCCFMLDPLKAMLRRVGMPFHNPYRRKRGDWNPLARRADANMPVDRLLAYLRPEIDVWGPDARMWTWQDLRAWLDVLSARGLLKRGAKKTVTANATDPQYADLQPDLADLHEGLFMDPANFERALYCDTEWWESHLLAKSKKPLEFPLQVYRKRGPEALREEPKITIGSIHSVKGGQADTVYLVPDVSGAGMREWLSSGEKRDSIVRQMYVGITRARQRLVLCEPSAPNHVDMRRYVPAEFVR